MQSWKKNLDVTFASQESKTTGQAAVAKYQKVIAGHEPMNGMQLVSAGPEEIIKYLVDRDELDPAADGDEHEQVFKQFLEMQREAFKAASVVALCQYNTHVADKTDKKYLAWCAEEKVHNNIV